MNTAKTFTASEIAAYNATHATPRKVLEAQSKWTPRVGSVPTNEFAHLKNLNRGATAEQVLEDAMLHGQDS